MSGKRVADQIVDTLVAAGVQRVYGLAGDSLNGITDSIRPRKEIQWVGVRHEEAAAFAAGAEADLTGRLAVCAGSCGPGNLHLINGLFDAHRNRSPVLAIAAQIPSREIGTRYFQETHPAELFRECSHFCEVVSDPEQLPRLLEIAIQTAYSPGGVAILVVPGDLALMPAVGPARLKITVPKPPAALPAEDRMVELATTLNGAKRVTILAGFGCAGAESEVIEVARRLAAPIVHTLRAKELLEHDNPNDVGMTGLLGFSTGYHAMMDCDVLLMLGTDFPYRQFYPDRATIVQVDTREEQIGRRTRVDLGLRGDVGSTLRSLLPRLTGAKSDRHLERSLAHYRNVRVGLEKRASVIPGHAPVPPQVVARALDEVAANDAIFTSDVGTPVVWAARYLTMNGQRRHRTSFWHGSMANALPQAIGAQLSHPGRQVISLSGDGGLAMLLGELLTVRQHQLPVKIVVFNNSALAFVELEMEAAGFLKHGTNLDNPDFSALANAIGIFGLRAESADQVRPMLIEALAHEGPALVDVVVDRQELITPPTLKIAEVRGLGLYLLKAVLSGQGDEVVDLAKSRLFR